MNTRLGCLLILVLFAGPRAASAGINLGEAVAIGGIKQWITIHGIRATDPVLLFLHGGPGSSAMAYANRFTGELQKHFVVVQWDQRESGKTAALNSSNLPLTVALFENDTFEMINYLRIRFSHDKIYLMGHSWGGFLGIAMAAKHPELIAGYMAINPMVHQVESEQLSLDVMKSQAHQDGNGEETAELSKVMVPFQNGEQLYYHRKWLAHLMGTKFVSRSFVETWSTKWLPVFNEASLVDFFVSAPEIKCPIYFFLGSKDYQTYNKLTEKYYQALKADKKELFWFTRSAHAIPQTEPRLLQEMVIRQLDASTLH